MTNTNGAAFANRLVASPCPNLPWFGNKVDDQTTFEHFKTPCFAIFYDANFYRPRRAVCGDMTSRKASTWVSGHASKYFTQTIPLHYQNPFPKLSLRLEPWKGRVTMFLMFIGIPYPDARKAVVASCLVAVAASS